VGRKAKEAAAKKGQQMKETDREIGQRIRSLLLKELTRGVVVAMVLEGNSAAEVARKMAGSTEPSRAEPATIRGTYSCDSYALADVKKRPVRNILHVSENSEIAEKEIKTWFKESEIFKYKRVDEESMYG
jgi:nucleoside-diphosphate kinase